MNKKLILISALLLTSAAIYAQGDLQARMELENAETAYSENRFNDALRHLDRTQELIGRWSHQISYLRILNLDKVCDYGDVQSPEFKVLHAEIKMYLEYAEANAGNVVMDKFREVYAISGKMEREQQALAAWAKVNPDDDNAVRSFLAQYGESGIAQRQREQLGKAAWARVNRNDTHSLQTFIDQYKGTPEAAIAQNELQELQKSELFLKKSILINGVRWASCNVDTPGAFAANPKDRGRIYTFEEAKNVCPAGWRLPTKEEFENLKLTKGESHWGRDEDNWYREFFSENDVLVMHLGLLYWSSTEKNSKEAYVLGFAMIGPRISVIKKTEKRSVRCVVE